MIGPLLLALLAWTAHPSDGVEMHLTREADATRLDFDFHGRAGYAIARTRLDLDLPPNYQFVFRVRGEAPPENLEFKLIDESGDNVWWLNRRDFVFPRDWRAVKTKKRQIAFAWGPAGGGEIRRVASLEIVVTAGSGGKGTVWFTDPVLEPLPPTPTEAERFTTSTIDLGTKRELGGLLIEPATPVTVWLDGVRQKVLQVDGLVWLPDAEARTIRVMARGRPARKPPGVSPGGTGGQHRGPRRAAAGGRDARAPSIVVQPPGWAPTLNDFYSLVARRARRGDYPRYLLGEQVYWTVVGADGAAAEALVGEDGAVEPFKGGSSIEPFLIANGKRITWADATITQSLAEGDLPIPTVTWKAGDVTMTMTAAVSDSSMLQLRYRIRGKAKLRLEVRPFQVNPSTQWLNTTGGASLVDNGLVRRMRRRGTEVDVPLAANAKHEPFDRIAARWREKLHRVAVEIPGIGDTIRTSIAYMLIHRDGPALQPGSRSYERAWIRDGALMGAVLLRFGHEDAARSFVEWFAKYQYESGKVPCCVDRRGADPVPENDSHGELIYLVAEIYRITHDADFARRLWPHVLAAARYIETLREQNHGPFEGLVTESISHEGYSAKPMHSYWDDFFALKGIEDAAQLAAALGLDQPRHELERSAADFRRDLAASIRRTIEEHRIDYIPGAAELGDFDPTSTAIAVSPLGFASLLPQHELQRTFDRYLESLGKPRDDYTPYEMRNIGALIRLGRRADALPLIERFLRDRRPAAWNEWAEVVGTDPRKPRFIGDMPHAWVASDFVRSMLDAIAFDREDGTLVIGAGVGPSWLPLHVGPLRTYGGTIDVRMHAEGGRVVVELAGEETSRMVVVAPDGREIAVERLPWSAVASATAFQSGG